MALLSSTYETELDIDVWYIHELEPMAVFLEQAINAISASTLMEAYMADQIAREIDQRILDRIMEEASINIKGKPDMLYKQNTEHEQEVFRSDNGEDQHGNQWHSRAGPLC